MPIAKKKLNQHEERKYSEALSALRSLGLDIDADQFALPNASLLIDGFGPEFCRQVFNINEVRSGVVVGVRLLARRPDITLRYCDIDLPWEAQTSLFMPSVADAPGDWQVAKGVAFERRAVLNARIEEGLSLHVGKPVEGLVIAIGGDPIPKKYLHGSVVEVELTFVDEFGDQYPAKIELRTNLRVGGKFSDLRRRESPLFARQEFPSDQNRVLRDRSAPIEPVEIYFDQTQGQSPTEM